MSKKRFGRRQPSAILNIKSLQFLPRRICWHGFLVQNIAESGQSVDELWQKKAIFKMAAASRHHLEFYKFHFFGHVTLIGFNICCSV